MMVKQVAAGPVGFRPLYRQVKDVLVGRIAAGAWRAGEAIPSEVEIAAELATSQGTVRKALDEMTAERLVVRRQGRGTFVARHDDARILFQFFKLVPDAGERRFPESRVLSVETARASAEERTRLGLDRMVIVQPSVYGMDNRCTLDMCAAAGKRRARAIVVVDDGVSDSQLSDMNAIGARGIRINALTPAGVPIV